MLFYDPNRRLTATEALAHPFFRVAPLPTAPAALPRPRKQGAGRPGADEQGGADGQGVSGEGRGGAGGGPHGHKRHHDDDDDGDEGAAGGRGGGSPEARAVAFALRKSFPPQARGVIPLVRRAVASRAAWLISRSRVL